MKVINDCLVLNKEETDGIIPILESDLEFNCMVLAAHLQKAKEFTPEMINQVRGYLRTLIPFFTEYFHNTEKFDDVEYKQMKSLSIDEVAVYIAQKKMQKGGQK